MGLFDFLKQKNIPANQNTANSGAYYPAEAKAAAVANDLALAELIYKNYPPWLYSKKKPLIGAGIGASVAAEIARLITIEMKCSCGNNKGVDEIIQKHFMPNIRNEIEKGWALGGLIIKPYYSKVEFRSSENNVIIDATGKLRIKFIYPGDFLIRNYDLSGEILDVSFFTILQKGYDYFVLEERQTFDDTRRELKITNTAYKNSQFPARFKWNNLSQIINLTDVAEWKDILPEITFKGVNGTLVGYYKPAMANNTDIYSFYGACPLVRAAAAIRRADIVYNNLDWEIEKTAARLFADRRLLLGEPEIPPEFGEYFIKLLGAESKNLFEIFSPDIRDRSYLNVFNTHLRQIENIVGLAHGTLSLNETITRTATEIAFSRQRTYATAVDNQKSLEYCVRRLAYAVSVWLAPTARIQDDLELSFDFDDSIVNNPQEQLQGLLALQSAGNIHPAVTNQIYFNKPLEEAMKMWETAQLNEFQSASGTDDIE